MRRRLFLVGLAAFAAGTAAGFAITRSRGDAAAGPRTERPAGPRLLSEQPGPFERGERDSLRKMVVELREENRRLKELAAKTPGDHREERLAVARKHWLQIEQSLKESKEDREAGGRLFLEVLKSLDRLSPDEAGFFVGKFREAEDLDARRVALFLCMACGGPEANRLMCEVLEGPACEDLVKGFDGMEDFESFTGRTFAVEDSLSTILFRELDSTDANRRSLAASLLGGHVRAETADRLRRTAASDPDEEVRIAAIESLGKIGDRTALDFLRSYPVPEGDGMTRLTMKLSAARRKLEKKFPN